MKISKPISFEPPSHKDDGGDWMRPGFREDMRHEVRSLAKQGHPVSISRGKVYYRNIVEGVAFCTEVVALAQVNQGRSTWMIDAFKCQIWVERVLKALSVHGVVEVEQLHRGLLAWQWHGREFGAYEHRNAFLCLRISDGENYREDLFPLDGPLTSGFILSAMQRIEGGLTDQIGLKLFLGKKDMTAEPVPNGLDVGLIHIHVGLDHTFSDSVSLSQAPPDEEFVRRIRGYVQEYKTSPHPELKEESSSEAMTTEGLDLA